MALPRRLINCMHKQGFSSEHRQWGMASPGDPNTRYILRPESFMDVRLEDIPKLLALPMDSVESEWTWREEVGCSVNLFYTEHVVKPFLMARMEAGV